MCEALTYCEDFSSLGYPNSEASRRIVMFFYVEVQILEVVYN